MFFTHTSCFLYTNLNDLKTFWPVNTDLEAKDLTGIYDCKGNAYNAEILNSTLRDRGLIFKSKSREESHALVDLELNNPNHTDRLRKLMIIFLSSRRERTADTGKLGMEDLNHLSSIEDLITRIDSYCVVNPS